MQEPIISVSGLRGIVGTSLTPEIASRYVAAYAAGLEPGTVVVTRDGRQTGRTFADVVRSTMSAAGFSVIDADVAATPTTGVLIRHHGAVGGVQISASHNPPEYNGLKLFNAEGRVISADDGALVLDRYASGSANWATFDRFGQVCIDDDPHTPHLQRVLECVDVDRIAQQKYQVLLDSNHGAGSQLGRKLLAALGCEFEIVGEQPDGLFAHPPEPTADNLSTIGQRVTDSHAVVGFCQDPDADRLALIDETGKYIGEEYTLAICVAHVLSTRSGAIVTNCSTSRMSQDIAESHGQMCFRSKVGEANVAELMQEKQAVFGGEGNGGPIDPRVGFVRDSFVGMACVLDAMSSRGRTLRQLASEIPAYAITKSKVQVDREMIPAALDALETHFQDAQADRLDGLRLDWESEKKWLLVRASNTEPIVRLFAESANQEESARLCAIADEVIRSAFQ